MREAALQGFTAAQINLAALYAQGIGTVPDAVRAYAWLTVSAEHSNEAKHALDDLIAELDAEQLSAGDRAADALREKMRIDLP